MSYLNIELKAKCADPSGIRENLKVSGASFAGIDEQIDTYFNTPNGRLKLREGTIENNLIYYNRLNHSGPKDSHFCLAKIQDAAGLKEILKNSMGIKIIVRKRREIYYIGNVKFHIDEVPDLGSFIEIEAGNILQEKSRQELLDQCNFYLKTFGIKAEDFVEGSYSDMLMEFNQLT